MLIWPAPLPAETAQDYATRVTIRLGDGTLARPTLAVAESVVMAWAAFGMQVAVSHDGYILA